MSDSNEYYDRLANAELQRRQAAVDTARDAERARIVAAIRADADHRQLYGAEDEYAEHARRVADQIERGESGDLAAGDE